MRTIVVLDRNVRGPHIGGGSLMIVNLLSSPRMRKHRIPIAKGIRSKELGGSKTESNEKQDGMQEGK